MTPYVGSTRAHRKITREMPQHDDPIGLDLDVYMEPGSSRRYKRDTAVLKIWDMDSNLHYRLHVHPTE